MKPGALATTTAVVSRNRWLVLGVAATLALVLLVALSLTGVIGGGGNARRDAVAAYIEEVNATQRSLAIERQRIGRVYAKARRNLGALSANVPDLERSAATLRRFDTRLRALDPPPDAVKLHRRLVALSAAEAAFAAEIVRLALYLPALTAERKAIGASGTRLQRDLALSGKSKTPSAAQTAAFDRFAVSVEATMKTLRTAPVPTALRPVKSEEISRAAELSASARGLAAALNAGSNADAQILIRRFSIAAAGRGNAVERKAVIAFDAQARRINSIRLAVAKERSRLDLELR